MPLSPASLALLEVKKKSAPLDMNVMGLEATRKMILATAIPVRAEIFSSEDVQAPTRSGTVTVRIYKPSADNDLPVLMYLHGGGFAIGNLDMHEDYLRNLSNKANIIIVSVDYRLAPEHPYPAGLDDCMDVWTWLQTSPSSVSGDTNRLAVAGDSAGGALSFALALRARDEGNRVPSAVVTLYGTTAMRVTNPDKGGEDSLLTVEDCHWYWDMYTTDPKQRAEPYCNVENATDLSNLGANLVITAEYDVTRDATEEYAQRLKAAGNIVEFKRYDGELHGFAALLILPQAHKALAQIVAFLKEHL